MTRIKRLLAVGMALLLALGLSACSKDELQDKAADIIVDMATRFGFITEDEGSEDEVQRTEAAAGGEVAFPEGFTSEDAHLGTLLQDGVLYIRFNGIQNRSTDYFVATSDSVTLTAYATSSNPDAVGPRYKAALWELSEDMAYTSYVEGATVYFTASGEGVCYSYTITGLTPGRRYKVTISYDGKYFISGGMTVSPVSDEDLVSVEGDEG